MIDSIRVESHTIALEQRLKPTSPSRRCFGMGKLGEFQRINCVLKEGKDVGTPFLNWTFTFTLLSSPGESFNSKDFRQCLLVFCFFFLPVSLQEAPKTDYFREGEIPPVTRGVPRSRCYVGSHTYKDEELTTAFRPYILKTKKTVRDQKNSQETIENTASSTKIAAADLMTADQKETF